MPLPGVGNVRFSTGSVPRDKEYTTLLPHAAVVNVESRCLHAKQFMKLSASALAQVNELDDRPMEDEPTVVAQEGQGIA